MSRPTIIALVCLLFATPAFASPPGVTRTLDEHYILAQKDVGPERWALTFSLQETDPFHATGNVFFTDGRAPAFVDCYPSSVEGDIDRDPFGVIFVYQCFGNVPCPKAGSCYDWNFVSEVQLPLRFFLPPL